MKKSVGCNNMFKNKKGYSTGFAWVFGLVTLFGLGLLYIIFKQVLSIHLVPIIKDNINNPLYNVDNATRVAAISGIDKYMTFFDFLPVILFFVVVIYFIVVAIRKERESEFM